MSAVEVTLPGGLPIGGQWCRSAWLRPVTGYDEEFLLGAGRSPAAERVTELICRCLCRLGPMDPVSIKVVRQLNVGDREYLMLHVRRLTLGDRVSCLLHCPNCEKKMDLELSIEELLQPPYRHEELFHETDITETDITGADQCYRVVFRLPNGEDQEAVSRLAATSVESATNALLRRCIKKITSGDQELASIPEAVERGLPARMAELDPQAELLLELTCPECGTGFVVPFDIADYFYRELAREEREFYRGVHRLSLNYHWDEAAILKLSRRKRQIYLELLADDPVGSVDG